MKRIALCVLAVVLLGLGGTVRECPAADEVPFATPVVVDATPVCTAGTCAVATETAIARRHPVVSWFQENRPVRRVLRGTVRFVVGRRCCS